MTAQFATLMNNVVLEPQLNLFGFTSIRSSNEALQHAPRHDHPHAAMDHMLWEGRTDATLANAIKDATHSLADLAPGTTGDPSGLRRLARAHTLLERTLGRAAQAATLDAAEVSLSAIAGLLVQAQRHGYQPSPVVAGALEAAVHHASKPAPDMSQEGSEASRQIQLTAAECSALLHLACISQHPALSYVPHIERAVMLSCEGGDREGPASLSAPIFISGAVRQKDRQRLLQQCQAYHQASEAALAAHPGDSTAELQVQQVARFVDVCLRTHPPVGVDHACALLHALERQMAAAARVSGRQAAAQLGDEAARDLYFAAHLAGLGALPQVWCAALALLRLCPAPWPATSTLHLLPVTRVDKEHPGLSVQVLLLLADHQLLHPAASRAAAVVAQRMHWFTGAQLAAAWRAMQRLAALQARSQQAGQQGEAAAGSGAAGSAQHSAPLEVLLAGAPDVAGPPGKYPAQGPPMDDDPRLDLAARIGLRIARDLAAPPSPARDALMAQLGMR
eukprot:CAMPEP_0202877114 /NCGR_PEP_ID=MMETSP1391-20130828/30119_1 /ASSEMBLY_ACC=CAM_ASM_000867 /TAXON_ID=1034604 /ORGANISM="Chlamydomonas leiostraca, Strain SAG 11-49" /LENGTH=505 /DNA_ID=CAMNT_0049559087 /DNA_START=86 /DNA_END=1603 /DNA_ORIENTATION=-